MENINPIFLLKETKIILQKIAERSKREVCRIQAVRRKTTLFESKFGGIPYCP